MKTELPKNSIGIKDRLERIVQEILLEGKKRIVKIILFGSYARGTWVRDSYVENHRTYSYQSDLDIMVITKNPEHYAVHDHQGHWLKKDIEERIERAGLGHRPFLYPSVTLVIETISHVNKELGKKQYFYSDIKKEGILLYDSGECQLAEARELNWEEQKEIAKDDFEHWFPEGLGFMDASLYMLKQGRLKHSAFMLHQATESFYTAILLVFTGYKGKEHDIIRLGSLASNYSNELLKIFPRDTKEHEDCFTLLQEAYIRARYDKKYKITQEQLVYLIKRVEKLKLVTEEICQAWINQ